MTELVTSDGDWSSLNWQLHLAGHCISPPSSPASLLQEPGHHNPQAQMTLYHYTTTTYQCITFLYYHNLPLKALSSPSFLSDHLKDQGFRSTMLGHDFHLSVTVFAFDFELLRACLFYQFPLWICLILMKAQFLWFGHCCYIHKRYSMNTQILSEIHSSSHMLT